MTTYKLGKTPYYERAVAALRALAGQGRAKVTQHDVAVAMGATITASFRRAMQQAEYDSLITRTRVYSERGGLMVVYELHVDYAQLPMKEPPI